MTVQQQLYHADYLKAHAATGYEWPCLYDFRITIVGTVVLYLISALFKKATWQWIYSSCTEKDEELRKKKARKGNHRFFCGFYFTLITAYGYVVLSQTDFLPPMLGGNPDNKIENVWKDFPIVDDQAYAKHFKLYYLLGLSYHVMSSCELIAD